MQLYQELFERAKVWREKQYQVDEAPAIAEILQYATESDIVLRFLREPQLRALEVYWYLRLVEKTPKIFDLYERLFSNKLQLLKAFGISTSDEEILTLLFEGDAFWDKVKTDDEFVGKHHLETLRESLSLDYPNYILALTMGAGKTILIGTIIATEFALALEYPEGGFMQNALVFAPGTTIIEALKEIADIPFDKILPPRLYKPFIANLKLTYTRSGKSDIPVEADGLFNLIVTNTEKIALRRVNKSPKQTELEFIERQKQEELQANLRLQKITSLPNLGIFSDEAHHTHGQKLGEELKRVRSTIDYIHSKKDVIAVINTTGTPYYKRQTLKDVVFWYGLSEGIEDNILKSLENGVKTYDMSDESQLESVVSDIIADFFSKYGNVTIPSGAKSKIAFYFPTEESLLQSRECIEKALVAIREEPLPLKNTQTSTEDEVEAFRRLNDASSPHRVILLVGKGTEGWNCPSLFSTALIRAIKSSNNFVLQAGTRCLRQVAGNTLSATIYLDLHNHSALDKELQENYGSRLTELTDVKSQLETAKIVILKTRLPQFVIKKRIRKIVAQSIKSGELTFTKPSQKVSQVTVTTYNPILTGGNRVLHQSTQATKTLDAEQKVDLYSASTMLSGNYRLDALVLLGKLQSLYQDEIPLSHLTELGKQVEKQSRNYEISEEVIEEALALVRFQDSEGNDTFETDEHGNYYTEILYTRGNGNHFVQKADKDAVNKHDFGFHYSPYNFDSSPEKDFLDQVLVLINQKPEDVEDIFFTGAITDPGKTDFYFEYKGLDGRYHNYHPDFVIRLKSGKFYIVEIKSEREIAHPIDGQAGAKAMALKELETLNEKQFKYEIIFTPLDSIPTNKLEHLRQFIGI